MLMGFRGDQIETFTIAVNHWGRINAWAIAGLFIIINNVVMEIHNKKVSMLPF